MQLTKLSIWGLEYRAIVYAKCYASTPDRPRTEHLEAIQINEAKSEIARAVQKKVFPNKLKKEGHMWLQESSKIQGLCPYYRKEGRVIRLCRRNQLPKGEAVDLIVVNISTGC